MDSSDEAIELNDAIKKLERERILVPFILGVAAIVAGWLGGEEITRRLSLGETFVFGGLVVLITSNYNIHIVLLRLRKRARNDQN